MIPGERLEQESGRSAQEDIDIHTNADIFPKEVFAAQIEIKANRGIQGQTGTTTELKMTFAGSRGRRPRNR